MQIGRSENKKATVIHALRTSGATVCENAVKISKVCDGDWADVTCRFCHKRHTKHERKMAEES